MYIGAQALRVWEHYCISYIYYYFIIIIIILLTGQMYMIILDEFHSVTIWSKEHDFSHIMSGIYFVLRSYQPEKCTEYTHKCCNAW